MLMTGTDMQLIKVEEPHQRLALHSEDTGRACFTPRVKFNIQGFKVFPFIFYCVEYI